MAAPTGITQVAGGYLIADGATRVATAAVNIYGIWFGNQSAKNAPHNVLGLASMAVTSNQTTQQLFQLGGDFGLSRQNLINLANGGFTNVFSAGQGAWQVIQPYKDAYTNFKKIMSLFQILLVVLFYCLIGIFYWYSKGRFIVKDEKKDQYAEWVNKYGSKASKACVKLLIIYTVVLIFQLVS